MARMMESREAMRDGTVRPLPTSEQFYTRSCARCAGLLVNEWYYDLNNTGEHSVETLRCVQCGHRVDPVILQNQIRPWSKTNKYDRCGNGTPRGRHVERTRMTHNNVHRTNRHGTS